MKTNTANTDPRITVGPTHAHGAVHAAANGRIPWACAAAACYDAATASRDEGDFDAAVSFEMMGDNAARWARN